MSETKDRLLDAAEELFAERGVAETSLREITALADANLAAVNYHFGGKDGLLEAVFARRLRPVNRERLALLDAFEREAGEEPVPVEQILYANLAPPFRTLDELGEAGERFMRIVARINADPSSPLHAVFVRQFDEIRTRYLAALGRALPQLDEDEVERRFHYTLAAMIHTFCWSKHIGPLSAAPRDQREQVFASLVAFAAAGMRAPRGGTDIDALAALEERTKEIPGRSS